MRFPCGPESLSLLAQVEFIPDISLVLSLEGIGLSIVDETPQVSFPLSSTLLPYVFVFGFIVIVFVFVFEFIVVVVMCVKELTYVHIEKINLDYNNTSTDQDLEFTIGRLQVFFPGV